MDGWEDVRESQDRSRSAELFGLVVSDSVTAEVRTEAARTMGFVADPRMTDRLWSAVKDPALLSDSRLACLDVLVAGGHGPGGDALRAWWGSGDEVLDRAVMYFAERTEADLIGPVADDPAHPMHHAAIEGLEFSFEEPEWQHRKIRALGHPDSVVRRTAASVLLWDEPVAAEAALLAHAAEDDPDVACRAFETLEYYRSRQTLAVLAALRGAPDPQRAQWATERFESNRFWFLHELSAAIDDPVRYDALRAWMGPIEPLLDLDNEWLEPDRAGGSGPSSPKRPPPPTAAELITALDEIDGPWAEKLRSLRSYDWTVVVGAERRALAGYFAAHLDPEVRMATCRALADWNEADRLLQLAAGDDDLGVRKVAVYYLGLVEHRQDIADFTWYLIAGGTIAGTRAHEAVRTYSVHESRADVLHDRLVDLALRDRRESVRTAAINELGSTHVAELLSILAQQPLVTWAAHVDIVEQCSSAGMRPATITDLWAVDDLDLAATLAKLEAACSA